MHWFQTSAPQWQKKKKKKTELTPDYHSDPCQEEGGCCIQAQTHAAQPGRRSARKVLRSAISPSPSIPPSTSPSISPFRCILTLACRRKPEAGRRNCPDVGVWRVSLYPSSLPPSSSSSSLLLLPPPPTSLSPSPPLIYKPEL